DSKTGSPTPSGLRNLAVSADGLHVFATAPNEHPDPAGATPWTKLPGKVVDIDLTPLSTDPSANPNVNIISGSRETFGVAVAPGSNAIAFTNSESDASGVSIVTDSTSGIDFPIALDLDKLATSFNPQLSVHNASGIVFSPDHQYAFVT